MTEVFHDVPLEIFGELLLRVPDEYARLKRLLPRMPSEDIQRSGVGDAGLPLLYKGQILCAPHFNAFHKVKA